MEVDGDNKEEEIKSELKQEQLECYFTVLGQVWPETQTTQDKFDEKICSLLCDSLHSSTWKLQVSILKSCQKYINRLYLLKSRRAVEERMSSAKIILEKSIISSIPCLGNLKYTVIRTEALGLFNSVVCKLKDIESYDVLSSETWNEIVQALSALSQDSNPELQDKAANLQKLIALKS